MGRITKSWAVLLLALVVLELQVAVGSGVSHEGIKHAMLRRLGLSEVPQMEKRDVEKVVVPRHLRNKYISMLRLHKEKERRRRALPSLAGILRGIPGNADTTGDVVYTDPSRQRLVFDMKGLIPHNSEVTMAELKLFKKGVRSAQLPPRRHGRPVTNARVSVYWVSTLADGSNTSSLIDSRLVPVLESGWKSLDVTQAVQHWMESTGLPMHLEVWVEAERVGTYAAQLAKLVRFASQSVVDQELGKPELVLHTISQEEYGSAGDCDGGRSRRSGACCRQEYFINFRELAWTQYWIIEPPGYQAYRCVGGCRQPPLPFAYGERRCSAAESASLPVMYLVKRGDYTEIEVAEFPNMVTERCACSVDNLSLI
ncbi:lefty1 [Rhinoraja longicauda]